MRPGSLLPRLFERRSHEAPGPGPLSSRSGRVRALAAPSGGAAPATWRSSPRKAPGGYDAPSRSPPRRAVGEPGKGRPCPAAEATEATIPLGPRADEATAAAVAATVSEVVACFEAGDALRAYALFTDDLARQFGPSPGTPREEAEAFLAVPMEEATPAGEPVGGEVTESQIVAVTDVMALTDGRVGAFVVTREEGQLDTVFIALEREGDRLLADELVEFATLGDGGEDEGE